MSLLIPILLILQSIAHAEDSPVVAPPVVAAPVIVDPVAIAPSKGASSPAQKSSEDDGAYEIDYEEESEIGDGAAEEAPEPGPVAPTAKKVRAGKVPGAGPSVQGSRAKNRFAPILKSDSKSVYQKDGKHLDVDTD